MTSCSFDPSHTTYTSLTGFVAIEQRDYDMCLYLWVPLGMGREKEKHFITRIIHCTNIKP
jgi:hypothetical protein